MENFSGKKRPTISLSLFTTFTESISSDKFPKSIKSPRNFQDGVVGLGIVAAMTDLGSPNEVALSEKSPRSSPIPIVSAAKPAANFRGGFCVERAGAVVDELSESYTCVISHFGNNLTSKRVYFDDKLSGVVDDPSAGVVVASGVFSTSPLSVGEVGREFWASDFLSCCYLCKKQLHGLDIFMYRGEKAFCSAECRDKHMRSDDHKDKCRYRTRYPTKLNLRLFILQEIVLVLSAPIKIERFCGVKSLISSMKTPTLVEEKLMVFMIGGRLSTKRELCGREAWREP